jgi:hypothetical protein
MFDLIFSTELSVWSLVENMIKLIALHSMLTTSQKEGGEEHLHLQQLKHKMFKQLHTCQDRILRKILGFN